MVFIRRDDRRWKRSGDFCMLEQAAFAQPFGGSFQAWF